MRDSSHAIVDGVPVDVHPPSTSPLVALNTHAVGYVGVGVGGAVITAIGAFFHWLTDPKNLIDLWGEIERHEFGYATATVVGLFIGVVGAIVIAIAAAWLGRPPTIASSPSR